MPSRPRAEVLRAFGPYEQQLLDLPFIEAVDVEASRAKHGRAADLRLRLRLVDGSERQLLVQLKRTHLPRDSARHLRARLGAHPETWLLAAPYVGAPLGDALEKEGVLFVDQVGNCYLHLGDQFIARIQGRTRPKSPARSKALRSPGFQVLYVMLAQPDLVHAPQREVAEAAGTSRQPVIDLLARLVEERVLVRRGRKHDWVHGPSSDLLDLWIAGYRAHLRPRLYVGRYQLPVHNPKELEVNLERHFDRVRYGGTAGAYRLVGHYRGPSTVAYLEEPTPELLRALGALPTRVERSGDLVWMRPFGAMSLAGETPDTVHPLLVYAELMSDPDPRAGESARLVRERFLKWSI